MTYSDVFGKDVAIDERAEVGLLTRNIQFFGEETSEQTNTRY